MAAAKVSKTFVRKGRVGSTPSLGIFLNYEFIISHLFSFQSHRFSHPLFFVIS